MHVILGMAGLAFMVVCAVHVVKTGRAYYWLWIILFFSIPGCLIYFFVEMLPDLRRSSKARRIGSQLVSVVDPGRNLRQLQEQLEIADTVSNRTALARHYLRTGEHGEAIELYQRCLQGVFEGDPGLTLELSYALFLDGRLEEAKEKLECLGEAELGVRLPERNLLYARTLEQMDDVDAALVAYETALPQSSGEEARCRYAVLLEEAGYEDKAKEIYRDIVRRAKHSPGYVRRAQKTWIIAARHALDRLG